MKKFLAMILAAMMVVTTGAAFAEWDPMADAEPVESVAAEPVAEAPAEEAPVAEAPAVEAPAAPAVDVPAPDGYKLYQYEPFTVSDYGTIIVRSAEYVETATALEPAEDSAKFPASNGNLMLQIRMLYHPMTNDQGFATAFACKLVADAEYPERLMLETAENSVNYVYSCWQYGADYNGKANKYLVNLIGTDNTLSVETNGSGSERYAYYLYDYIIEVPATLAESGTPVYLQLNVNGTELYYQVQ